MQTNKIVLGILAHVDAGKTTLAENMLYMSGSIRSLGRVDHRDTLFDNHTIERERGITVFSKQARLKMGEFDVTLLDTPGHIDFSAEMERTLQVLDYAILIISGADGIQAHTVTLWRLLKRYEIPTFIFINKMDQIGTDREKLMNSIKEQLTDKCIDFSNGLNDDNIENIAMSDEGLMEMFLSGKDIPDSEIAKAVIERKIYPCYFGSALKGEGLEVLYNGIFTYMSKKKYTDDYAGRVYKIGRDNNGIRLTYLKVTGGSLKVKMSVSNNAEDKNSQWNEKIDQIRIYSGGQYTTVNEVYAGDICVLTGLKNTHAGDAIGAEEGYNVPVLEPVLNYRIIIPEDININTMYTKLMELEEEEPQLHITYNSKLGELYAQVMGEVQLEILKSMIFERYGVEVLFDTGNVVYKETINSITEGVGHFEPLRHYAEVHIVAEPLERGSGVQFDTACSEDMLDKNWQRLILTHIEERQHPGILTGSDITDVKFTLVAGRAHQKHTEGGDFRQATYRAIRNALAHADNILLEPVYSFRIEVPMEYVGRVLNDIQKMDGTFDMPQTVGEYSIITGVAPVVAMNGYQKEILSYSRGRGRIACTFDGYRPCHNAEEVINQVNYNFENDIENPASSVFCVHGAGYVVEWDKVQEYMHIDYVLDFDKKEEKQLDIINREKRNTFSGYCTQEELDEIFERTYGSLKKDRDKWKKKTVTAVPTVHKRDIQYLSDNRERYLLVDGYNIIFAWKELKEMSETNLEAARQILIEKLCNYRGYKNTNVILVFDAYKVKGNPGEIIHYNNIDVIYTKEAETADTYIEKVSHELGKKYRVTVATSDYLEQCIIWGNGAIRMSANELYDELEKVNEEIRTIIED